MNHFTDILARLKTALGVKTDKAVAEFLDISASKFSRLKSADTFPTDVFQAAAQGTDLAVDWILTGQEQIHHGKQQHQQQGQPRVARTQSVRCTPDYRREQQRDCRRSGHFTHARYSRPERFNRRRFGGQTGQWQFCVQRGDVADCRAFQAAAGKYASEIGGIKSTGRSVLKLPDIG